MAYDEGLAERLRELLRDQNGVEKKECSVVFVSWFHNTCAAELQVTN